MEVAWDRNWWIIDGDNRHLSKILSPWSALKTQRYVQMGFPARHEGIAAQKGPVTLDARRSEPCKNQGASPAKKWRSGGALVLSSFVTAPELPSETRQHLLAGLPRPEDHTAPIRCCLPRSGALWLGLQKSSLQVSAPHSVVQTVFH